MVTANSCVKTVIYVVSSEVETSGWWLLCWTARDKPRCGSRCTKLDSDRQSELRLRNGRLAEDAARADRRTSSSAVCGRRPPARPRARPVGLAS